MAAERTVLGPVPWRIRERLLAPSGSPPGRPTPSGVFTGPSWRKMKGDELLQDGPIPQFGASHAHSPTEPLIVEVETVLLTTRLSPDTAQEIGRTIVNC